MMEKNNLIENIRDFFKEKYDGIKGSESFLSFEPIGSPIDASDFTDSLGNISEAKAIEELSIIGDRLPEINDLFYSDSSRLSSTYKLLIDTATFNTNLIEEDVLSTFSEMHSAVKAKLEHFENASLITPQGRYLPINPSIKKWFDPAGSFWMTKSFSIQEKGKNPSDKKLEASSSKMPLTWRANFVTNSNVLKTITKDDTVKTSKKYKAKIAPLVQFESKAISYKLASNHVKKPKTKVSLIKLKPGKRRAALVLKNKTKPVKSAQWNNLNLLKHLQVSERLQFTGQLAVADTANLKPVESDHFNMSFEYCIVNLDRPWLDRILFDVPEWWYCKSLDEGFFSNGKKNESNDGILKCYTTAMILIKNLEISASWSDQDKANAKESIALGNFNITDSEFIGNTLKSNGIQVIGWMCNILPKLPLTTGPKTND